MTIYETRRDAFVVSADPARLDMEAVCDFLARSYWADKRPRAKTERAFENSLVFGLYDGTRQVGVARVVSDHAVIAYLCDVFIHEDYRGRGLGKWLLESVLNHPDLKGVRRWLLVTRDAHELYRKFGFEELPEPEKWMQALRPFAGE